jgi:hypothetical protein
MLVADNSASHPVLVVRAGQGANLFRSVRMNGSGIPRLLASSDMTNSAIERCCGHINRPAALIGNAVYIARIATVHLVGALIFIAALTGTAVSLNDPVCQKVKDAARVMLLCYHAGAIKYAVQTCEPAASIITAVYGGCASLERNFKHAVELEQVNDPLFSEAILIAIRKSVESALYSLILDTRASSANKCS